jgi:hypothetical protein
VNPVLRYTLARTLLFAVCLGLVLVPDEVNVLLKLLIALLVSAAASYFLLRQWRDDVAEYLAKSRHRRLDEKERLRSALAGEDERTPDDEPDLPTTR